MQLMGAWWNGGSKWGPAFDTAACLGCFLPLITAGPAKFPFPGSAERINSGMKSLLAFLLGIIVGGITVLYLPETRRDELNREFRQQVDALQVEMKNLARQLKSMDLSNLGGHNGTPSPTPVK
jgi:hypothetical protein